MKSYNLFVIGGGSGGVAAARRARALGATVALAEASELGGTCVNRGCIPKKLMWYCGSLCQALRDSKDYGFSLSEGKMAFSWEQMKIKRDSVVKRLNEIYTKNLTDAGIDLFRCRAALMSKKNDCFCLEAGNEVVRADHVLLATGGRPKRLSVPGVDYCLTSDDCFELITQPKKLAIFGAGYIAAEFASIFSLLGTETHFFTRGKVALRNFDSMLSLTLNEELSKQGCAVHPETNLQEVSKDSVSGLLTVHTNKGEMAGFDNVLIAIGRDPNIEHLGLENLGGIKTTPSGYIQVDDFQNTSIPQLYALGDVCGKVQLTPMAISAARKLMDRLFGSKPNSKADYFNVPTVVFTHPTIGTVGLTEDEAVKQFGRENLNIYTTESKCLFHNPIENPTHIPAVRIKLICLKSEGERIVGLHMIGMGADEILQGFAVAMRMGATKQDFNNCVAIHPTVAEEIVLMAP